MSPTAEAAEPSIDYGALSRPQKLAIFLIVIGPEAASEVLKQFGDADIEVLCREMSQFNRVSDALRHLALAEFAPIIGDSVTSMMGGSDYARDMVERSRGDQKAGVILSRAGLSAGGNTSGIIKEIAEMESRQIFNLIKNEQPQTIAFILSYLGTGKAAEIFNLLVPELRNEVVERLGTIDSTSPDLVGKIVRNIGRGTLDKGERPSFHSSGGVGAVADLLKGLDKELSKSLLASLEERNAELGAAIRKKMFSFEDLIRLQASDLQRIMREVDSANLAIAMKTASEPLKQKLYAAVSKRAAESLRDEIGMLGQIRAKELDAAQGSIIQVVRRLEDEGAITLDGGDGA